MEDCVSQQCHAAGAVGTNRSVIVREDRVLSVSSEPRLRPRHGQVLIDVAYCGICGSDLHFRDVPGLFPAGTIPGHEVSGRIAGIGSGVAGWSVGDRVAVLPFGFCGACPACVAGDEHVCPRGQPDGVGLGSERPGGYAEELIVDAPMLFALPESVSDQAGALVEPLAVAVHAIEKAEVDADDEMTVIGAGPIGLLTALVLQHRGLKRTLLISRNEARAETARRLGVQTVALSDVEAGALEERPPTRVFECAGTSAALRLALTVVKPLGRVVLVGIAMEPLEFAAPTLVFKEAEIRGASIYRRADFQAAIDLLASGGIPAEQLITGIAPLERTEELFQELSNRGSSHVKVLLQP
jgi:2-desacetyl-2-hydroxyethyl bacteriochlorophyllide A dehydrogenase